MIDKEIEEAINKQINKEIYSAHLYLSMSAYFEFSNLRGFANWMYVQYQEEMDHAMKFYRYINERGGKVRLYAVSQPPAEWKSPLDAFEMTLKHELGVTKSINDLVDLADRKHAHATFNLLQWYIDEQIEEESNDANIIQQLKMVEDSGQGLIMIDRDLAARVYIPLPTALNK